MNRIVTMVLKNLPIVPGAWQKLCRYAKHPEKYSEEEMYRHIQYILKRAVRGGNIDLQVSGTENIPKEGGFMPTIRVCSMSSPWRQPVTSPWERC